MSKTQLKITDRVAMTLVCPAGKRNHFYADISGNGLGLIVSAAGSRVWKFRYSYADRRNDMVTLGSAKVIWLL